MKTHLRLNKNLLSLENLLSLITFLTIILLLLLRFQIYLTRFFDLDEFTHLFRSYLIASGKLPYRDFGYFYSPLFAILFSPFFHKESLSALFLSRSLEFAIFIATIFTAFLVGKTLSRQTLVGLFSAFLFASLPVALDKTIEIRPDNLAILFWLLSFFFLLKNESFSASRWGIALAGLCFGLAFTTLTKLGFAYPGLLTFIIIANKKYPQKLFRLLILFHLSALIPLLIILLPFVVSGNLSQALYSIFIMPLEISQAYGTKYFVPFYPFTPTDAFYGLGGKSLPWITSNFILLFGVIGFAKTQYKAFFLVSLVSFAFALLFVYKVTLLQYYLPLFFLLTLISAQFLAFLLKRLSQTRNWLFVSSWLFLLGFASFGFWQTAKIHLNWTNTWQIDHIHSILSVSKPTDYFYDMVGYHLFRPSGYYLCCELLVDFTDKLSGALPSFAAEMDKHQTKFVSLNRRLQINPDNHNFVNDYLMANYKPSENPNLLIRKTTP